MKQLGNNLLKFNNYLQTYYTDIKKPLNLQHQTFYPIEISHECYYLCYD